MRSNPDIIVGMSRPHSTEKNIEQEIASLLDIKYEALFLQHLILDGPVERYPQIEAAFDQLVDRFYEENRSLITPAQYEAAKNSIEYFIFYVDQLIAFYKESGL
ncbi:MAG: hypothetical protein N2317_04895 [Syntrophales bacterium]|nr:hypothetical protein [Syntrophales bacterium]